MKRPDKYNKELTEIPPSGIRKFFDLVIGNDDIISLGVGEPDFATPWNIREKVFYTTPESLNGKEAAKSTSSKHL